MSIDFLYMNSVMKQPVFITFSLNQSFPTTILVIYYSFEAYYFDY